MTQYFKGDATELKYYNSASPRMDQLSAQKDLFFDDAYACFLLGELLYDEERAPLANAIPRSVFRESFSTVFDAFVVAGSFESYLTVFRKVFGEDVVVNFTVPDPGKLLIDIEAASLVYFDLASRRIVDNEYVYDKIVDRSGDNILSRSVPGLESEYEVEQMLHELVPGGIYTEITLTVT